MEPNPPINRFRHVLKTYKDSKSPWVVLDTAVVALYLVGQDSAGFKFNRLVRSFHMYLTDRAGWPPDMRRGPHEDIEDLMTFINESADDVDAWWPSQGYATVDEWIVQQTPPSEGDEEYGRIERIPDPVMFAWQVVDLFMLEHLPERHRHDRIIPWVAREFGRASKAVWQGVPFHTYAHLQGELVDRAPAIAMWAEHEHVDLNKTSAEEALEAIQHFDAFRGEMPQGEVVYTFEDGWTVQKLTTDEQLEAEGQAMQHCVGDYCLDEQPGITILSLRDERGMPHVTMEWDEGREQFTQVQGKQNQTPIERYRWYVVTFINGAYGGDPLGLMLAGTDPKDIDFTDQYLYDVDFASLAHERGYDFSRVAFTASDLLRLFEHVHGRNSVQWSVHFSVCFQERVHGQLRL